MRGVTENGGCVLAFKIRYRIFHIAMILKIKIV